MEGLNVRATTLHGEEMVFRRSSRGFLRSGSYCCGVKWGSYCNKAWCRGHSVRQGSFTIAGQGSSVGGQYVWRANSGGASGSV